MTTDLALLRLLQLVSPSLPVGAFTYSQGIEWAVEAGWIRNASDLEAWLTNQLEQAVGRLEVPLLARMYAACEAGDVAALAAWCDHAVAWRETAELRAEEHHRGRALADLLVSLEVAGAAAWRDTLGRSQLAGVALAAVHWQIPIRVAALGYAWGWLENLVLAAVKLIPLGQTDGQRVLQRLAARIPTTVASGLTLDAGEIGASLPALAIASSAHETQYTRLFRS
ncbi:MAG: urease accessory UreF family protein [Gammaproteobacteria bacterium]